MHTRRTLLTTLALSGLAHADLNPNNTPDTPFEATAYSNGCGGDTGIGAISSLVNYFADTQSYVDSWTNALAPTRGVNFRPACDLHDAGYAGGIVYDRINGGVIDFRSWSRLQVDEKFRNDLQTLCRQQVPTPSYKWYQPGTQGVAREKCLNRGFGLTSWGALSYFDIVRSVGAPFFDADPFTPGTQSSGPRANN
ncbi:hypothetical protein [Deinococcus maricopensis]|uniref:Phospholipase A2 n=1 Tax=Deinococcus maricopensis (strain DSM 21211 / LMG 22137 / NRRL B-23946 / LB-34) TaxID=709986 RepID=E8UB70_DEIML|nr:hypothetical protein [Deinococcus maricopensis]ADV68309.1 hypothetical protein Deima_2678 [Deinococcus maricopensis DSM 21211]